MVTCVSKSLQAWHPNWPAPVEIVMAQSDWPLTPRDVPLTAIVPAVDQDDGLAGDAWYVFCS